MTRETDKPTGEKHEGRANSEAEITEKERKLIEDTIQRHRSTLEELAKR